jgi:hypothetical protein
VWSSICSGHGGNRCRLSVLGLSVLGAGPFRMMVFDFSGGAFLVNPMFGTWMKVAEE